jgi:RNA polymerase sigma-70 factor (ECF subfamily)
MPRNRNQSPVDEYDLLQRARRLDEAALSLIFDTYYRPLYFYLYAHLGHGPTAEDLAADVFQIFLKEISANKGPTRLLRPWLYQVAHNLMVDELRRRKHHEHDLLDDSLPSREPGVSDQTQEAEERKAVRNALRHLPVKQQAVLTMKFLEGLTNEEIAQKLQMTEGTVRALQFRGLRAIGRYLEKTGSLDREMDEK